MTFLATFPAIWLLILSAFHVANSDDTFAFDTWKFSDYEVRFRNDIVLANLANRLFVDDRP